VALGVAASVLIPVLRAAAPRGPQTEGVEGFAGRFWRVARPYFALALLSLLVGLLVLAFFASTDKDIKMWWEALLAGYVSDSTLQKLRQPPSS
jgi:hypothetical protein